MALVNSDSLSDTRATDSAQDLAPDSSALRVSTNTQLESGIPPARRREDRDLASSALDESLTLDDGVNRLHIALQRVTRSEASLASLSRGLKHLSLSATAAREANSELMLELERLRSHLAQSHAEEHALRFRAGQLEQLLDLLRQESARERQFLIEQQDAFLVQVLTDHEQQRERLEAQFVSSPNESADGGLVAELRQQRDQARETATRFQRERDLAWQELALGAGPSSVAAETVRRRSTPPASEASAAAPVTHDAPAGTVIASIQLRPLAVSTAESSNGPDTQRSLAQAAAEQSAAGDESGHPAKNEN